MSVLRRWARTTPAVDATAFLIFAIVGMLSHDGTVFIRGFVRDALPLWVGWFAVALAVGLYRRPTRGRLLAAWAVGVPLGVLIRGIALGRHLDGSQLAFLITTMIFTGLMIVLLRWLARRVGA